jgi:hypothetical protein
MPDSQRECAARKDEGRCGWLNTWGRRGLKPVSVGFDCWVEVRANDVFTPTSPSDISEASSLIRKSITDEKDPSKRAPVMRLTGFLDYYARKCAGAIRVSTRKESSDD